MKQRPDLEIDLLKDKHLIDKCVSNPIYAQHLYAALCNNRFFYNNIEWTCSWRYAGGLVSQMTNSSGDYLDYYCSGISDRKEFVPEGTVTDEIRWDLLGLGWSIKPYE